MAEYFFFNQFYFKRDLMLIKFKFYLFIHPLTGQIVAVLEGKQLLLIFNF